MSHKLTQINTLNPIMEDNSSCMLCGCVWHGKRGPQPPCVFIEGQSFQNDYGFILTFYCLTDYPLSPYIEIFNHVSTAFKKNSNRVAYGVKCKEVNLFFCFTFTRSSARLGDYLITTPIWESNYNF